MNHVEVFCTNYSIFWSQISIMGVFWDQKYNIWAIFFQLCVPRRANTALYIQSIML